MINVENLSKSYGPTQALQGISFTVQRGDVVGFLGPNGAGKSTTMKILTGYLLPTSGRATVDGLDVVERSLDVRRRIGYLPESTPLYSEMLVRDYLTFAAEIRGVPGRRLGDAVERVVSLCGLQRVVGKNIVELSKGFRQRVGLAQAMVHEPDVLILDEPTSGLDPNQIVEVRKLIQQLAEKHTVILSTHYLQEVDAVATRVVIVNRGQIVADDTKEQLLHKNSAHAIRARVKGPKHNILAQLGELMPGRRVDVTWSEGEYHDLRVHVTTELRDRTVPEAVADLMVKNGWAVAELSREQATLEDVFRSLTAAPADGAAP
jgi:ABC-2 type transport system ATP-binding protein